MSAPTNLTILHSSAPAGALCWRDFTASEDDTLIHVCVSDLCEEFDISCEAYGLRRLDILKRAFKVAQTCPVILYTGLAANDVEAPCGCYGYDVLCDYHRHHEDEVAECFCCDTLHLKCSYHAALHRY